MIQCEYIMCIAYGVDRWRRCGTSSVKKCVGRLKVQIEILLEACITDAGVSNT